MKTLLAMAALFVCFFAVFTQTGEAKEKIHRLTGIESRETEIDGRAALEIRIALHRPGLVYALSERYYAEHQLLIELSDAEPDHKLVRSFDTRSTIAPRVTIIPRENRRTALRIEAAQPLTNADAYRIRTEAGETRGKRQEYLVIDIFADGGVQNRIDLKGHSIVLDPGHGGSDSGAIGFSGVREKDVALAVALRTEKLLRGAGAEVIMTRTRDTDVAPAGSASAQELQARVDVSLAHPAAELFLSIHCNAFTNSDAHGMETYYYPKTDADERFAILLNEELAAAGGLFNRGVKYAKFYLMRHTEIPASLVELGFLSNPEEEALLASADYQETLAQALVRAIARYFE